MIFNSSNNSNRNSITETPYEILRRIDDMTIAGEISTRRISTTGGARRISRRSLIGQYSGPSGNNMASCFSSQGNEESPMIFRHQSSRVVMSDHLATEKEANDILGEDSSSLSRKRSKKEVITIIENAIACLDDLGV